jgi:hypothetical protein
MNSVSKDFLISIYQFVPLDQIPDCGLVCRGWRAYEDKVWEQRARMIYGKPLSVTDVKAFLQHHMLRSNDDIVNRFQDFMGRIQRGENARFRVVFGRGGQTLDVVIKTDPRPVINYYPLPIHHDFDFTESYVAFNGLGDGSLTTLPEVPYALRSFCSCGISNLKVAVRAPSDGTAVATFFTDRHSGHVGTTTPLSDRMLNIVSRRLEEIENPRRRRMNLVRQSFLIAVIAAMVMALQR